jgi:tetrahydromethanopterin S-methyltransferase subunit G
LSVDAAVGAAVGSGVGVDVGLMVGLVVGTSVSSDPAGLGAAELSLLLDGLNVGAGLSVGALVELEDVIVGAAVSSPVGASVVAGSADGASVGSTVGTGVEAGSADGASVTSTVGTRVGAGVSDGVGALVGDNVGESDGAVVGLWCFFLAAATQTMAANVNKRSPIFNVTPAERYCLLILQETQAIAIYYSEKNKESTIVNTLYRMRNATERCLSTLSFVSIVSRRSVRCPAASLDWSLGSLYDTPQLSLFIRCYILKIVIYDSSRQKFVMSAGEFTFTPQLYLFV